MKPIQNSFAGKLDLPATYSLKSDDQRITVEFEVKQAWRMNPEVKAGSFYEGLWKHDCGEMWVASSVSARYVEFNLGPNGAWWSCAFSDTRVRDIECTAPQVQTSSEVTEQSWKSSLTVSWDEIRRCLGDDAEPKVNVTLLNGGCPDENPPHENLISVVPLKEVDFHRPQDWVPLSEFLKI